MAFEATDENRRASRLIFRYWKCSECRLLFLEALPADLANYYQGEYYEIPSLGKLKSIAARDQCKLPTVKRFICGGKLLEVGPAFGTFACGAKDAGFEIDVIEMDGACCQYLASTVGVNVIQSDEPHRVIPQMPPHDVIAIWHVIEHLPEPFAFIESAAENLRPGGILVIATPNPDAFQFRVMGRHWPHLDAPRHLTLLPVDLLRSKAEAVGLTQVFLTSDDADARSWNRFGWQRLLMNRVPGRILRGLAFVIGWLLSILVAPWDRSHGSAYTLVLQKKG